MESKSLSSRTGASLSENLLQPHLMGEKSSKQQQHRHSYDGCDDVDYSDGGDDDGSGDDGDGDDGDQGDGGDGGDDDGSGDDGDGVDGNDGGDDGNDGGDNDGDGDDMLMMMVVTMNSRDLFRYICMPQYSAYCRHLNMC